MGQVTGTPSNAAVKLARAYAQFVKRVEASSFACKHGHPQCSDRDGGECCEDGYAMLSEPSREAFDSGRFGI